MCHLVYRIFCTSRRRPHRSNPAEIQQPIMQPGGRDATIPGKKSTNHQDINVYELLDSQRQALCSFRESPCSRFTGALGFNLHIGAEAGGRDVSMTAHYQSFQSVAPPALPTSLGLAHSQTHDYWRPLQRSLAAQTQERRAGSYARSRPGENTDGTAEAH
jgi:hypothetical protein